MRKPERNPKTVRMSREEIKKAIHRLSTEDVKERFLIGNAILQQGLKGFPELISAMSLDKPEIRRTVAYILGELAKQSAAAGDSVPQELMDSLRGSLTDEDPKVRRNAAVAFGDLKNADIAGDLMEAHSRETSPWVKSSMVLALSSIGGPKVIEYLSSYQPQDSAERAGLEKALDRLIDVKSDWRFVEHLADAIPVELWVVEGLEDVVEDGLKRELALPAEQVGPGRVLTSTADLYSLFALRTFNELLIPLAEAELNPQYGEEDVNEAVARVLRQENVLDRIFSLHEDNQQPMRYRLEIRGKDLKHYVRRNLIMGIADRIASVSPAFVNSTSNYNVEIRVLLNDTSLEFLLKPFTIPDNRFSYRLKDIPAAINPAVAAGVVRLVPKLSPESRVLDPFCGSGTMLIERGLAGGYKTMVGVDISRMAIEAARQNVKASGLDGITLIHSDMRRALQGEPFDEIIANMPFGIRTGKHDVNLKLYQDFFDLIPRILTKQGLIILYTQEVRLVDNLFRKSKQLKLKSIHRVASGGLRPAVFIGTRK